MSKKEACCPVEVTLKVIGGRWKVLIIHSLLNGTMQFNQLQRDLAGILTVPSADNCEKWKQTN